MFIQNEYYIKYQEMIENRNNNPYDGYTEKHHIIPVSLGGSNDPINIVALSGEEHLKVHILLPYFTEGTDRVSMIYAWNMMSNRNGTPMDYEEYSELKENHSKVASDRMRGNTYMLGYKFSDEQKLRKSLQSSGENHYWYKLKKENPFAIHPSLGRRHTEESKEILREKATGRLHSQETKDKMSAIKCIMVDKMTFEERKALSPGSFSGEDNGFYGKLHSEKTKKKMSKSWEDRPEIECPYCGLKSKSAYNMKRYHFEKCKNKEGRK